MLNRFLNKENSYSKKKKLLLKSLKLSFIAVCLYFIVAVSVSVYNNSGAIVFSALLFTSKSIDIDPPQLFGKIGGVDYKSHAKKARILRDHKTLGKDIIVFEDFTLDINYPSTKLTVDSGVSIFNIQDKIITLENNVVIKYGNFADIFLKKATVDIVDNVIWSSSSVELVSESYKIQTSGLIKKSDEVTFKGPLKAVFN